MKEVKNKIETGNAGELGDFGCLFFPAGFGNISKQLFLGGMFCTWSLTPLKVETDVKQTME